jgi:hypothetical protein
VLDLEVVVRIETG